jgi:predicted DNA-binding transcriptional regulator AlpA
VTTDWAVSVTMVAPGAGATVAPDAIGRFADLLESHHGAGGFDTHRLDAAVTVAGPSAVAAARRGATIVAHAAERCGLDRWTIVAVEALAAAELDRRNATAQIPDIVGTRELMNLLGISRQRLDVLRHQLGFPAPVVVLAATPVWDRAAIDAWVEQWDRRTGRPKRRTRSQQPTATGRCRCGCGEATEREWLPGHDQRAVHQAIGKRFRTVSEFLDWFDNQETPAVLAAVDDTMSVPVTSAPGGPSDLAAGPPDRPPE